MRSLIPLGITAKNEAKSLPDTLKSLYRAKAWAEQRLGLEIRFCVVLNDTTDNSEDLLRQKFPEIEILHTSGGLVEAQRAFANRSCERSPFVIFSDADIVVSENALYELCQRMLTLPEVHIAYVEKTPLPPARESLLGRALYLYNKNNGYQTRRNYFNGQLFAIREWHIPRANELKWASHSDSNFYDLKAGIRCDDIYLSRITLQRWGPSGIRLVPAMLYYHPPETFQGMYNKYQRMRLEIERMNLLFPETVPVHNSLGRRRFTAQELSKYGVTEKFFYVVFLAALQLCKVKYRLQKFYYTWFSKKPCPTWVPVYETKRSFQ